MFFGSTTFWYILAAGIGSLFLALIYYKLCRRRRVLAKSVELPSLPQSSPPPVQYVSTHLFSFSKNFRHGEHPDHLGQRLLPPVPLQA
jgi:hypothetical protein